VIARIDDQGNELGWVQIDNDRSALWAEFCEAGPCHAGRDRGDLRLVLGGTGNVASKSAAPGPVSCTISGSPISFPEATLTGTVTGKIVWTG
jgi:hypothetical protein